MSIKSTGNILIGAALFVAVCFTGHLIGQIPAGEDPGTQTQQEFAFLSLSKVLNAHKGLKNAEVEVENFVKEGRAQVAKLEDEIRALKDELMVYAADSKELREGQNEIERKELGLKHKERELILERDLKLSRFLKDVYGDIERVVGEYAKERGIKAVFTHGLMIDQVATNRPEEVLKWVSLVDVVWYDPRLDISDAIITIINDT